MFCKKGIRKYFANFTGKHRCWSLFVVKLQAFRTTMLKNVCKRLLLNSTRKCKVYITLRNFIRKIKFEVILWDNYFIEIITLYKNILHLSYAFLFFRNILKAIFQTYCQLGNKSLFKINKALYKRKLSWLKLSIKTQEQCQWYYWLAIVNFPLFRYLHWRLQTWLRRYLL